MSTKLLSCETQGHPTIRSEIYPRSLSLHLKLLGRLVSKLKLLNQFIILNRGSQAYYDAKKSTFWYLVETQGLEPWTPCLQSRCSSQLSYVPTNKKMVGDEGLEPPTSSLSVTRSNQLS